VCVSIGLTTPILTVVQILLPGVHCRNQASFKYIETQVRTVYLCSLHQYLTSPERYA